MFIFNVLCMCVSECFVTAECRRSAASVVGHWGRGAPPMPGSASEQDRTGRLKTRELKTRHGQKRRGGERESGIHGSRTRNLSKCSWDAPQHQFNFVRRLSWSISSRGLYFSENALSKCASQPKKANKNHLKPIFWGFKFIDVGTPEKLVSSACYDTQQICVYLQPFSC